MKKFILVFAIFASLYGLTPAEDAIKKHIPPQGKVLDIQIIDPKKGTIELSDNTDFKVLSRYKKTLNSWLFGVKVTVRPLHGKSSVYIIQDIKTKESIQATKISP